VKNPKKIAFAFEKKCRKKKNILNKHANLHKIVAQASSVMLIYYKMYGNVHCLTLIVKESVK
jgi:hypothetical protein